MNWFNAFVLYVLIWWVALFAVLPLGTRPVEAPDLATGWRGAPAKPRLLRKIIITTLISLVLWGASLAVIQSGWLSFRHGILGMPADYS